MKASVFMTSVCLGGLASGAFAADFSIKGNVSETVEGSNNYFLASAPSGPTLKSTTAGTLDFLARTPTTSYLLDTNFSYYHYYGPGALDTSMTSGTPASATFTINHLTELNLYNFAASWNRADAAATQLAQTGTATAHGSITTKAVSGGVTRDLGRIDTISWMANASSVSFTDSTQTPYVDFNTGTTWNHGLTQTTGLINSVNFDWFSEDNTAKSQRLFWTITSGLQSRLSSRLTVSANVQAYFANSYQSGIAQAINPTGGFQPTVGAGHSWGANVAMSYQLLKNTQVSLMAAQVTIPTFTGQLQQSQSIGATLGQTINEFSNLSFSANYAQATSPNSTLASTGTSTDFFSASVNYGYQLTRDWRTSLSYTFAEAIGTAKSSTVLFRLSRDFTLMGNPTAINQAEAERARQRALSSVGYVFPTLHY